MSQPTEFIAEPDLVTLDLHADSGEAAVRVLHERLVAAASQLVVDPARFLADLLERMRMAPVCIASDVALPHARSHAVARMVLAVGRAVAPIAFDAEHRAVRLVFLIGTPNNAVREYLQTVAALSRFLRQDGMRARLNAAGNEAEFRALLSGGVAVNR